MQAEFIRKAIAKHGNRYSYVDVKYKNSKTKVSVRCKLHGNFEVTPANHLNGRGCRECGRDRLRQLFTKPFPVFLKQARARHGEKYKYNGATYISALRLMDIACPEHGVFVQSPSAHLRGQGCPDCGDIAGGVASRLDPADFVRRARAKFPRKFNYSKTTYERMRKAVTIICRTHGPFEMLPVDFLNSVYGCPLCALGKKGGFTKTTEFFVAQLKDVFGDAYDLSKVRYTNKTAKVRLKCHEHGWFEKSPEGLLKGEGCQKCSKRDSEHRRLAGLRRAVIAGHAERTAKFLLSARKLHGDRYDYSRVRFKNQHEPVTIICPQHGPFRQIPDTHLRSGCKRCASADLKGLYSKRYFRKWPDERSRPACLYYVRLQTSGEVFYKVGITVTSIKRRFGGYTSRDRCRITVLRERHLPLQKAFQLEQRILNDHGQRHSFRPNIRNRAARSLVGVTECFSVQIPDELLERCFG